MIQAPFNSSCVALQWDWNEVFHRAVPEIWPGKYDCKKFHFYAWILINLAYKTMHSAVFEGNTRLSRHAWLFLSLLEACCGLPDQPVLSIWIEKAQVTTLNNIVLLYIPRIFSRFMNLKAPDRDTGREYERGQLYSSSLSTSEIN